MSATTRLAAGDLVVDPATREAFLRGVPLKLTRLEFDVLAYLLAHQERAVNRQELLDEIWGSGYSPESNVVDVVVASLRRKLGDERQKARYIVTIPAVGYRVRGASSSAGPQRRLIYLIAVAVAVVAIGGVGIILSVAMFRTGGSGGAIVTDDNSGGELTVVVESRTAAPASISGDCHSRDLTISDWKSSGSLSGDLTGSVTSTASGTLFYTAGCLEGSAKGSMIFADQSGNSLEVVLDSIFSVVQLRASPAPAAIESTDALTVSGGTGRFANARGDGTCETTLLLDYADSSSLTSASRSRCHLMLSQAEAGSLQPAVSVRLVANPSQVSLVGTASGDTPSATYVLVLYRNEGQSDLTNLTLTVLPVDGVSMNAVSRSDMGKEEPPLRTWRLADLHAGDRQMFDFSLQFQSTDGKEVPLIVRISSPDMEKPVDSDPFTVTVE